MKFVFDGASWVDEGGVKFDKVLYRYIENDVESQTEWHTITLLGYDANKGIEVYLDSNNFLHNENGYALKLGSYQLWYWHGKIVFEETVV